MSINYKKEYSKQLEFIREYIQNTPVCKLNNYYMSDTMFELISTNAIKNILKVLYTSSEAMEAVSCFFDALFNKTHHKTQNQIYDFNLNKTVKNWLKKVKGMKNTESVFGDVYLTTVISNDIKVVIKTYQQPKKIELIQIEYEEMVREYFIGMYGINKLRRIIPNFIYTLGMFSCSLERAKEIKLCEAKNDIYPFLALEYIEGKSIYDAKNLTYDEWLDIFIQVLVALEVGQREIGFCHNDLHTGNVMARPIDKPYSYSVNLDQSTYTLKCEKYIATIIDFGMSSVVLQDMDGKDINVRNHSNYKSYAGGQLEFILHSGLDMFHFLVHSYSICKFKPMIRLFDFFNGVNPYQSSSTRITEEEILKAKQDYSSSIFTTEMCRLTPKMFLDWIIKNKLHNSTTLSKTKRETYSLQLKKDETLEQYNSLFKIKTTDKSLPDKNLTNLLNCLKKSEYEKSYILSKYASHILSILNSQESQAQNQILDKTIKTFENKLISNDTLLLNQYTNLELNSYYEIPFRSPYSSKIVSNENPEYKLDVHIITYFKKCIDSVREILYNKFEKLYKTFLVKNSLYTELKPYLQFYYTIKELKLDGLYQNFIDEFLISDQYVLYTQNIERFNKDERFLKSLLTEMRHFIKSIS
jgi:hypothetical protein